MTRVARLVSLPWRLSRRQDSRAYGDPCAPRTGLLAPARRSLPSRHLRLPACRATLQQQHRWSWGGSTQCVKRQSDRLLRSAASLSAASRGLRAPSFRSTIDIVMVRRMPVTVDGHNSPATFQSPST